MTKTNFRSCLTVMAMSKVSTNAISSHLLQISHFVYICMNCKIFGRQILILSTKNIMCPSWEDLSLFVANDVSEQTSMFRLFWSSFGMCKATSKFSCNYFTIALIFWQYRFFSLLNWSSVIWVERATEKAMYGREPTDHIGLLWTIWNR